MERLFEPNVECTDPDTLQFCHKISDNEFWYCEINTEHIKLFPGADTLERKMYEKYRGHPKDLLRDARTDKTVYAFLTNYELWLCGAIEVDDFTHEEKVELLKDYGYSWNSFSSDAERNQIICENYFEEYPYDYRNY